MKFNKVPDHKILKIHPNHSSEIYGAEACAPNLVTEIAAALLANRIASFISFECDNATAKAPLKISPAAVVSTAFTLVETELNQKLCFDITRRLLCLKLLLLFLCL